MTYPPARRQFGNPKRTRAQKLTAATLLCIRARECPSVEDLCAKGISRADAERLVADRRAREVGR